MAVRILQGDCREVLKSLPAESVHCVVTSPPYWGLRDYGTARWEGGDAGCDHRQPRGGEGASSAKQMTSEGTRRFQYRQLCERCGAWRVDSQLGLEPTPQAYVENMVAVFREARRVLRKDGTLWLNLGDSYATGAGKVGDHPGGGVQGAAWAGRPDHGTTSSAGYRGDRDASPKHPDGIGPLTQPNRMPQEGLKPKDLVGIPWRVAFALQADGWYLRQDIIWAKPNPMPESVRDRCTKAHEYLFLLAKSERYYFDQDGITEPCESGESDLRKMAEQLPRIGGKHKDLIDPLSKASAATNIGQKRSVGGRRSGNKERKPASARGVPAGANGETHGGVAGSVPWEGFVRNKRSVWTVGTQPFDEAHFATFPPALIEPAILAGCPNDGTVLDPFGGAGTTGLVADRLGRAAILIELNPAYIAMAEHRIRDDAPLFTSVEVQTSASAPAST